MATIDVKDYDVSMAVLTREDSSYIAFRVGKKVSKVGFYNYLPNDLIVSHLSLRWHERSEIVELNVEYDGFDGVQTFHGEYELQYFMGKLPETKEVDENDGVEADKRVLKVK